MNIYSLRHVNTNSRYFYTEIHHFQTDEKLNLSTYYFNVDSTEDEINELTPILEGLGLSYIDVINGDDVVEIDSVELKILKKVENFA
jgi:deoxyxylulose-5-phosphate synthase